MAILRLSLLTKRPMTQIEHTAWIRWTKSESVPEQDRAGELEISSHYSDYSEPRAISNLRIAHFWTEADSE